MDPILQQLQQEIATSLQGLDATKTQLRSATNPDKWSIQQIVQHLTLTYASTEVAVNARLAKGTPTRAQPTLQQRIRQYTVTTLGYFPSGREAPSQVCPPANTSPLSGEELARQAAAGLTRIDQLFVQAEVLFGSRRSISHVVLGSLSIHQWRRFHLIHGRHHIRQIGTIRAAHRV
ncbi:MAG TPA: DinB family protein [Edaphobacter sp.]